VIERCRNGSNKEESKEGIDVVETRADNWCHTARNAGLRHLPPEHRLLPVIQRFAEMLVSSGLFGGLLSVTK
jgi:hypothetical protein